jgi:hypothetical protein
MPIRCTLTLGSFVERSHAGAVEVLLTADGDVQITNCEFASNPPPCVHRWLRAWRTAAMTVSPIHRSPSTLELHVDEEIRKTRASRLPMRRGRAARQSSTSWCWTRATAAETASPPAAHGR